MGFCTDGSNGSSRSKMLSPWTSTTPDPATEGTPDFLTELGVGTSQRRTDAGTRTNGQFPACSYLPHAGAYQKAPVDHERGGTAMQITRRLNSPRPLATDPGGPGMEHALCLGSHGARLRGTLGEPCTVAMHRV